jgi:hypothetical protein
MGYEEAIKPVQPPEVEAEADESELDEAEQDAESSEKED